MGGDPPTWWITLRSMLTFFSGIGLLGWEASRPGERVTFILAGMALIGYTTMMFNGKKGNDS